MAPLDASLGPLDIDLMRRIRRYAPAARPEPVSAGESVDAAGDRWQVLWPPALIAQGTRGLTKVERAVAAYEDAAGNSPETRKRLDAVRDSETFRELLSDPPVGSDYHLAITDDAQQEHDKDSDRLDDLDLPGDNLDPQDGVDGHDSHFLDADPALAAAANAVRAAANDLSLILVSTKSRVLLTGDATRYAVSQALRHRGRDFNLVVTPHHGGQRHVPVALQRSNADFWASSAGGTIARQVSGTYDRLGWHHRTNLHGGAAYLFGDGYFTSFYFPWTENW